MERALVSLVQRRHDRLVNATLRLQRALSTDALKAPLLNRFRALDLAFQAIVRRQRVRLNSVDGRLRELSPALRIGQVKSRLATLQTHLARLSELKVSQSRNRFGQAVARLEALSPLASLERGHSITRKNGKVLTGVDDLKVHDLINILLARGQIQASVIALSDNHDAQENISGDSQ